MDLIDLNQIDRQRCEHFGFGTQFYGFFDQHQQQTLKDEKKTYNFIIKTNCEKQLATCQLNLLLI